MAVKQMAIAPRISFAVMMLVSMVGMMEVTGRALVMEAAGATETAEAAETV
jgi:hypothetical protein